MDIYEVCATILAENCKTPQEILEGSRILAQAVLECSGAYVTLGEIEAKRARRYLLKRLAINIAGMVLLSLTILFVL